MEISSLSPINQFILFFGENHERIPVFSAFTSIFNIFGLLADLKTVFEHKTYHFTSFKKNALLRHVVLLIPIFGNVAIFLYDLKTKKSYSIFLEEAINADGLALQYAREFQDDERIVYKAFEQNIESFAFASIRIRNNQNIVSDLMKKDTSVLQLVGDHLRNNQKFNLEMINLYGISILHYVDSKVLSDKIFMHKLIQIDVKALKFSKILRNDKGFVLQEAQTNKEVLQYAGKKLKDSLDKIERFHFLTSLKT